MIYVDEKTGKYNIYPPTPRQGGARLGVMMPNAF